jgi:hypothetical protein
VAEITRQAQESWKLQGEQLRALEAKMDYLSVAATRTGRIDWLNLAVGVVMGRFAEVVLAPDVMHQVGRVLEVGLGPLFGHPMPMLGP